MGKVRAPTLNRGAARTRRKWVATAYHEAGHAIANIVLRFKTKKVSIVPCGEMDGVVESNLGIKLRSSEWRTPGRAARERRHDKVVTILAGEQAQRRFNPRSVRARHFEADSHDIVDYLRALHPEDDELRAAYKYLRLRARNLVNLYWGMIQDMAEVLMKEGTVTGERALEVFRTCRKPLPLVPPNSERHRDVTAAKPTLGTPRATTRASLAPAVGERNDAIAIPAQPSKNRV